MSTYYLAEIRYDLEETPELDVFTADTLAGFLTRNIADLHYTGSGYEIVRLLRYDSGGALIPLTLQRTGTDCDSNDWLYLHYVVRPAARAADSGCPVEVTFTVCIDGRA